jgi:prolyl oligopeptidase
MTPASRRSGSRWLELGGVYAQAVLRGGSEYGEEWHAGRDAREQAARLRRLHRVRRAPDQGRLDATPTLAIQGGSNGGLLVGACLTSGPTSSAPASRRVGVLDMLRYDSSRSARRGRPSTAARATPSSSSSTAVLAAPQLKPGTKYPPTLILTGDHDDRVMPAHSFKFARRCRRRRRATRRA